MARPKPLLVGLLLFLFLAACSLGSAERGPEPTATPAASDPATGSKSAPNPVTVAASPTAPSGDDDGGDDDGDIDIGAALGGDDSDSDSDTTQITSADVRPILEISSIESFRQRFRLTTSGITYDVSSGAERPIQTVDIAYVRYPDERFLVEMELPRDDFSMDTERVAYIEADSRVFLQVGEGPWIEPSETLPIDPHELVTDDLDSMAEGIELLDPIGEEAINGRQTLHLGNEVSDAFLDPEIVERLGFTSLDTFDFHLWIDIEEKFIVRAEWTITGSVIGAAGEESTGEMAYLYDRYDINSSSVVIEPPDISAASTSSNSLVELEHVMPPDGEIDPSHQGGFAFTVRDMSAEAILESITISLAELGFEYDPDSSVPDIHAYTFHRGSERLFLSMDAVSNPNEVWVGMSIYSE